MNFYRQPAPADLSSVHAWSHAVKSPIPVAWCSLPEDATLPDAVTHAGLHFFPVRTHDLVQPQAEVVLLDVRASVVATAQDDVSRLIRNCQVPVLVRTTPDAVPFLLQVLRAQDDLSLRDEPLALVAYR